MPTKPMSVAERIAALKNIFADFGIPVLPHSSLEQIIQEEFGRGKRSKITEAIGELHEQSDASKLAACIGAELKHGTRDPQVLAVANVMQERLPALLDIVDTRQQTAKREQLLVQLLDHFIAKIPPGVETERLLRMLAAAKANLSATLQAASIGRVAESAGTFCDLSHLKSFGSILQGVTPALIALDQPDYPLEQKLNHCVQAVKILAVGLHSTNLQTCANVLDDVHWLAQVALPDLSDQVTIDRALQKLGVSLGAISIQSLQHRATKAGLTAKEITQIIYASADGARLPAHDHELLDRTQENRQYAAICGFLAKLGQDLGQSELEKISIVGLCMASMRQTFYEIKTNNLHAASFSESLGTILLGVGSITHNDVLMHIGRSILSGVSAYAGLMAVPGGATIAIPLAVCSVLGQLFLDTPKDKTDTTINTNEALCSILQQILVLQQHMRYEFAALHKELYAQHIKIINAIDQGYANIAALVRYNNAQILTTMRIFDQKLQDLQAQISQEFSDLYLEYVHDPLEEVAYVAAYGADSTSKVQDSKHKLAMWLLYKAAHPKVTGRTFALTNLAVLCAKLHNADACLSLINRYVNANFAQTLPEDLPHIPTWLQAAHAYAWLSAHYPADLQHFAEEKFLTDVLAIGHKTLTFVEQLALNASLWESLARAITYNAAQANARWSLLKMHIKQCYLQDVAQVLAGSAAPSAPAAHSAPHHLQLEPFTATSTEIGDKWELCSKDIPPEIMTAVQHGLGTLELTFTVDKSVNTFAGVHIAYGDHALPNHARDVLFKVDVTFKTKLDKSYLLTSTWFAYDLQTAKQRFEQYYNRKFKYGLRHTRYHWISLDGLANQVEGHGNTSTQKLIDYDRLGTIYAAWLQQAVPLNQPQVLERVKHNPLFVAQQSALLAKSECTVVHGDTLTLLRMQCYNDLRELMQQQRAQYATKMQQDPALLSALEKLDVYNTVAEAYMRLLNVPYVAAKKVPRFNELLNLLQNADALNTDLLTPLDELFAIPQLEFKPAKEYEAGEFYTKMQAAIARLSLLQSNLVIERLRLSSSVVLQVA